ncbi:MAG: sorbosone dehydrogenase family protein [Ignavibacteriaceae bacterium]|nr:sorbosone dehydrogenase family protein [Ignavibacteriaceae bacterium]
MTLGDSSTLFVGNRNGDKVFAVKFDDNFKAGRVYTLASGLNMPNGVAFADGDLYVAEVNRILKFSNIENTLENPEYSVIYDKYPTDKHHGWKFIAFGPDGKLYIPVGAPCNVCEAAEIYSTITRINKDGTGFEIFAKGVRNTVGFDWHPVTNELWFTDNGRDLMGEDIPSDELNHAPIKGMHFGFPYVHQGEILDPEFGKGYSVKNYVKPKQKLGPHVAALGMRFYKGNMFPENYKNRIFIAQRGSWNRTVKIGYRIMMVELVGNEVLYYDVFADGWLDNDLFWGRPVDVQELPDGSLLISDDYSGSIYRVTYKN